MMLPFLVAGLVVVGGGVGTAVVGATVVGVAVVGGAVGAAVVSGGTGGG